MTQLLIMFFTIFVAELGDKTQLATMLFASERRDAPLLVFIASASALTLGAALSVAIGSLAARWIGHVPFKLIAGIGFVLIGVWSLALYYRGD